MGVNALKVRLLKVPLRSEVLAVLGALAACSPSLACVATSVLPIWPGCVPVTVTGDIVRRRSAPGS